MFTCGFTLERWLLPLSAIAVIFACGEPGDRCAAPGRAEIEAIERGGAALPSNLTASRDRWLRASLDWVSVALDESLPDTVRSSLRQLALSTLDDALHLEQAPDIGAVADFFRLRIDRALAGIEGQPPRTGARVWKLYNHGFVVRTEGHCYAFDIFQGVGSTTMSREQMERLADVVEVLFISHRHYDHASIEFARLMLNRDKPVVVNPDIWPEEQISSEKLIRIQGNNRGHAAAIGFQVFEGHQGDIPNNVYLVQADGVSVMHTGDQHNRDDFGIWIDGFAARQRVDILLPNCWTLDISNMVAEIKPTVVITGHENELGHMVSKRESYGKSFLLLNDLSSPYVMMTWGESFPYNQ